MKRLLIILDTLVIACTITSCIEDRVGLTLIPSGTVSDNAAIDIRAGIVNKGKNTSTYEVSFTLESGNRSEVLKTERIVINGGSSACCRYELSPQPAGDYRLGLSVKGPCKFYSEEKNLHVVEREGLSTRLIEGAWVGLYHWSETEGKHWNQDIRQMTADQWRDMVRQMHSVGMDMIIIQEMFRNQEYVGRHSLTLDDYAGKAFYPSGLYPGRMDIACEDPVEAIMDEADRLGMDVMPGIGMFAWFDFTKESLSWHKKVAKEVWDRYGHHPSFYGFYVSEECAGNLYNSEQTDEGKTMRQKEIVDFFKEFKSFISAFAPEKPVMLATNSMEVPDGAPAYPELLENLDILCPFGFARMPESDLTGEEAASMLKQWCDDAGAHFWFDLEAFLFGPDMSLYPRPIEQILSDLNRFDCFEKVLCYQFPGVFNSSDASRRVGEESTVKLYNDYSDYYTNLK